MTRYQSVRLAVAVFFLCSASVLFAQQAREAMHIGPAIATASLADIQNSAAKVQSRFALGPLTSAERSQLAQHDAADLRAKVGIWRALPNAVLDLGASDIPQDLPAAFANGVLERREQGYVWTAGFTSEGAGAIRLKFVKTSLPASARVYVYSARGEVHGPYTADQMGASFFANTVFADEVFVEVQFATVDRMHIEVAGLEHLESRYFAPPKHQVVAAGLEDTYSCFLATPCVSNSEFPTSALADRSKGVAVIAYISTDDGNLYVCSGALLNNTGSTTIPYFLTANHCIGNQTEATGMELFWDYKYASCGGTAPDLGSVPRQTGAALLATSPHDATGSDFTLLRLNDTPPGARWYFGWNPTDIRTQANITTYRLHQPNGEPMHYSRELTTGLTSNTQGLKYFFSQMMLGANYGGSSGSAVWTYSSQSGAQVVGTLTGAVAASQTDLEAYCSYDKYLVKSGAFSEHYALMAQYLNPGNPSTPTVCTPSTTNVCLVGNRFQVSMTFNGAAMQANQFTPTSGLFSQKSDPNNIEVLLKMIDACSFNAKFWVYSGGTTDQAINITVVDTKTGTTKTYSNPASTKFQTITDSSAFSCP